MKLSNHQKEIIQEIYNHFKLKGTWSTIKEIAVKFHYLNDLENLIKSIDTSILCYDYYDENSQLRLTVKGISICEGSERDQEDFIRIVQLMVERYLQNPDSQISTDLIANKLNSESQAKKIMELIRLEGLTGGGRGSPDGKWTCNIPLQILQFKNIYSISEYLSIQSKAKEKSKNFEVQSIISKFKKWFIPHIRKIIIGIIIGTISSILVTLILRKL